MSLTENQKKIIRKITRNQTDSYCDQVSASDEFALAEIAAKKPQLLVDAMNRVNSLNDQKTRVEIELAKAQADVDLLND